MPEENAFKLILLAGDIEVNLGMPVKIAHLNARSLQNRVHYILIKVLVAEHDFDIFTVSETWLNNSVTEAEIPDYDLYRLDRHEKNGGGVNVHMLENRTRLNIYKTCLSFHPRAFTSRGFKYRLVAASRLLFAQYIDRLTLI